MSKTQKDDWTLVKEANQLLNIGKYEEAQKKYLDILKGMSEGKIKQRVYSIYDVEYMVLLCWKKQLVFKEDKKEEQIKYIKYLECKKGELVKKLEPYLLKGKYPEKLEDLLDDTNRLAKSEIS